MRKGNLIKMAAPAILSAAMMVSGLPVMAADFTSDVAVETEAQANEFDAADDTADALSLIHISEPTRRNQSSRMPSSA